MRTISEKMRLFTGKKTLFPTVLCLSMPMFLMLFLPPRASAWWSTGAIQSVHEQISKKAFDLVAARLVNKPFLAANRNSIVGFTTTAENDTAAHGGDTSRNGGNIAQWFNAFTMAHGESRTEDAAEYLGYCLHLIEDMSVPAHAFNVPHYQMSDPIDFDNFEFMADQVLNKLGIISLPDVEITETDPPQDPVAYYSMARSDAATYVNMAFSEYWHAGNGPEWNDDGPQGYYHDQTTNEDLFPKLYPSLSGAEEGFLINQLSEAVRYVGMFLLAVDRSNTNIFGTDLDTVQKVYIGYYQRPADPGGLLYWANRLYRTNGNLNEIIEAYANSSESQALYGTIDSNNIESVVNAIYRAFFGRDAEPEGRDWYVNGFKSGRYTAATIMLNVLNGAQNEDLQSINNKLAAANLFTKTIDPELDGRSFRVTYAGEGDATNGRSFVAPVGADSATVPTQDEATSFMKNNIADPGDPILTQ